MKPEYIALILSTAGIIISLISLFKSFRNDKLSQGQMELSIHQLLSQSKKDIAAITLSIAEKSSGDVKAELLNKLLDDALERELNAYEEACAKYLDGKVDKERFKRNYHLELRQLVENESTKNYFDGVKSPYKCILKVYSQWNNMEK